MEVALLSPSGEVVKRSDADKLVKRKFSTLSPKDRRPLNKAGALELTTFLRDTFEDFDYTATVLLSNLAVEGEQRGKGIGALLKFQRGLDVP